MDLAVLRRELSDMVGAPMILQVDEGLDAVSFANRSDVSMISQQGPATPDHVIRTKRLPLVGREVATYAREYERSFADHADKSATPLRMLDAAPRVVIDPRIGVVAAGSSAADATIAGALGM